MFTIQDIVDIAIKIERNGEKTYRKAQSEVTDTEIAALLGWLADQEAEHVRWFTEMRNSFPRTDVDSPLAEMGRQMLQNVVGETALSLDDMDFSKLETARELVSTAIELEADTVLFYEMLGGFIEDESATVHLTAIIREEIRHAEVLRELRDTGVAAQRPSSP